MHKVLSFIGTQTYTNIVLTLLLIAATYFLIHFPWVETTGFIRLKAIPVYIVDGSVHVQGVVSIDAQPIEVEIVR
jgi:hypothetical protein